MRRLMIATAVLILALALYAATDTSSGGGTYSPESSISTATMTSTTSWTAVSHSTVGSSASNAFYSTTSSTDTRILLDPDVEAAGWEATAAYVVFDSLASNLDPRHPDANGVSDVFHFSTATGAVTRASVGDGGQDSNGMSRHGRVSSDGRYVVFESEATNLVTGALFDKPSREIYVRDMQAQQTFLISRALDGGRAGGISANADISANGQYVSFLSDARNLTPLVKNGVSWEVYVHDRNSGITYPVSVGWDGRWSSGNTDGTCISADGRYVAFASDAAKLLPVVPAPLAYQVYVRDWRSGQMACASFGVNGVIGNGPSSAASLSGDGRFVVFQSEATNLVAGDTKGFVDIFVRDLLTWEIQRVMGDKGQEPNGGSQGASISSDGRYVAFKSDARNLKTIADPNPQDDVFVYDRALNTIDLASVSSGGVQSNSASPSAALSRDGRFVAFSSHATNLDPGAQNGMRHVFVRSFDLGLTRRISQDPAGAPGDSVSEPGGMN